MQKRGRPSFFLTITTGELQGLVDGSMILFRSISSTSSSMIFCITGLRGRYLCLIGRSVFTRMLCSILSVGPLTRSKAASSVRRKSRRRTASSGSCGVMPARACPCFPGVALRRGGGGIPSPTRAHRSVPISAGLSRVGRMLNVCCRVLPCIVTGSETRPGTIALVPSAK